MNRVVVIEKVALLLPEGTKTTAGTTTAESELVTLIASPPLMAALLSTMVPVNEPPPATCETLNSTLLTPEGTHACATVTGIEDVAVKPSLSVAIAIRLVNGVCGALVHVM